MALGRRSHVFAHSGRGLAACLLATALDASAAVAADPVADFYSNNVIKMIIRSEAGGTYDLYSQDEMLRSSHHHREITDAIAARAPDWAASVMSAHILAASTAATRSVTEKEE
jgi:DNA-binding GntR family transcriptional regulator